MTIAKKKPSLRGVKKVVKKKATSVIKKGVDVAFSDDDLGDTMYTLDWRNAKLKKPKYA